MTLHTPLWMQAGLGDPEIEYPAQEDRLLWGMIFNQAGICNTNPVPPNSDLRVSQRGAGANFSVDIQPGVAIILGTDVASQGFYAVWNDAVENRTIPAPPVSGTRIHRVIARIKDKLHNGTWTTYEWTLEVLEDTDGSGPPAVPASALSLATVTVSAGQASVLNANITDTRRNAVMGSGMTTGRYVGSDAERPVLPWDGELIWRTDKLCYELAISGVWYEVARRDGGGSAWTPYTPVLTAVSSNPVLGTGATAQGRYVREGRRVTVQVNIRFGTSGVSAGSGFYEISLPVLARSVNPGFLAIGTAYGRDNPAANFADGQAFIPTGVNNKVRISIDSAVIANNIPWTWSVNDELGFTGVYEAAS